MAFSVVSVQVFVTSCFSVVRVICNNFSLVADCFCYSSYVTCFPRNNLLITDYGTEILCFRVGRYLIILKDLRFFF